MSLKDWFSKKARHTDDYQVIAHSDLFDAEWYLKQNPDVAANKIDPVLHYLEQGWKEGREPSARFSGKVYLDSYEDVKEANINPLLHYETFGRKESRSNFSPASPKTSSLERYSSWVEDLHENKAEFVENDRRFYSRNEHDPKIFAYYLPQFHSVPVNDKNFGKGFTEWVNVARSSPLYYGHVQPRIPYDVGFYNLEDIKVIERQVQLAKQYGVYGFGFYYYWFSGEKVLEKPLKLFLNSDIDFKFHLMWANENWAKLWDGGNRDIILEQKFDSSDIDDFYKDILPYIKDERYEKIQHKPVLAVYRPTLFGEDLFCRFVSRMNELAQNDGFDGFYFLGTNFQDFSDTQKYHLEGIIEFPPHGMHNLKAIPNTDVEWFNTKCNTKLYDAHKWLEEKHHLEDRDINEFKCCFPSWDNSPRKAYTGGSVLFMKDGDFYRWLSDIISWTKKHHNKTEQYVYINAWNEWGEGATLEPDTRLGYRALSDVRKAVESSRSND